jgi:type IV pilus assembly protein PilB
MVNTAAHTPGPLGQMLLAAGAITSAQLDAALSEQRSTGERLGTVLVRHGADGEHVARTLARQLRLPHAAAPLQCDPAALRLIDRELAVRLRAVPLSASAQALRVAMADPLDLQAADDLRFRTRLRIEPCVATPAAVEAALVAAYSANAVSDVLERMPAAGEATADVRPEMVDTLRRASESAPVVALVDLMLAQAVQQRASDLHIEPVGGTMRVRARVDGVLRELMVLPPHSRGTVISRIKIMAGLDIAVKRRPQDGRSAARIQGREVALRVSTLPTHAGEKIVVRLLDSSNAGQHIDQLGMGVAMQSELLQLLARSHGVLLVTGPTGSGKTTTLYAALAALDRDRRNLVTLEDPVEYRLPGLTQVQVHRKAGLGFAAALRAVLRQDPDVIMVGELRDRETVEIALSAALTGHLVLATLHTNDALSAPARLHEMGAPAYLIAGGVIGVIAQRLARRLCVHCRAQRTARPEELAALGLPPREVQVFAPVGCVRCDGTGYRGRAGIYEMLVISPRMRERIVRRAPADALQELAAAEGFISMGRDAWDKVRAGLTSLGEVAPLLALAGLEHERCPGCSEPVRSAFSSCPACGLRLKTRCSCGARVATDWKFCSRCGRESR